MATTPDMAPTRKPAAARAARASGKLREAQLEGQVAQLQASARARYLRELEALVLDDIAAAAPTANPNAERHPPPI